MTSEPSGRDRVLLRLAAERGWLTASQAEHAAAAPAAPDEPAALGERLVRRGLLTAAQRTELEHTATALAAAATIRDAPVAPSLPNDADGLVATIATGSPRAAHRADCFGKYRILEELGRGAMGVVYRAEDIELHREVALKTVLLGGGNDPARVERFLREARTAATLSHPGIVPIHDMGVVDGMPYFAMGLVRGHSLDRVFAAGDHPEPRARVRLVAEASRAVGHAHGQRIIHRDLKPSNILVGDDGRVLVMDFGLAKRLDDRAALTATGEILGTPLYMPSEQMNGETRAIGPASDVYSLGAVLYEAVTGRPPHQAGTLLELAARLTHEDPVPPGRLDARVDAELETVVMKALDRDPHRRYPDATALAADLERWLAGEPVQARPVSHSTRLWRRIRRRQSVLLPAGALALAGLLAGGHFLWSRAERQHEQSALLSEGQAHRAAGRPREARDAFQGVLRLDAGCVPAQEGLQWADGELQRLEVEAARNQAALQKGARVQRVLTRWQACAQALARLDAIAFDDRIDAAERRKRSEEAWPPVEAFLNATPADPTSQAVAKAFAGWARVLAGRPDEGWDWIQESGRLDPDLPYGPLVEALACFCEYLTRSPISSMSTDPQGRMRFWFVDRESPEQRGLRERMEALLGVVEKAAVWGDTESSGFRRALAALRALRAERYEEAERELTLILDGAEQPTFRTTFLQARARVRCYANRFSEAQADLAELAAARPGSLSARMFASLVALGLADAESAGDGDPFPHYRRALDALEEARAISPEDDWIHTQVGITWSHQAEARAARGEDPRADLERAAVAHRATIASKEGWRPHGHYNLAGVLAQLGDLDLAAGKDPMPLFREALAQYDAAVRWPMGHHYMGRASLRYRLARFEDARDGDSRPSYAAGLADLEEAVRTHTPDAMVRPLRSALRIGKAEAEERLGGDPQPDWTAVVALADDALREQPDDVESRWRRGFALLRLGKASEALPDLEAVAAARPENAGVQQMLARARTGSVARPKWVDELDAAERRMRTGDYAGARPHYESALAAAGGEADRLPAFVSAHYNLACIHALLAGGRTAPDAPPASVSEEAAASARDAAFEHLQKALALGWNDLDHLRRDSDLVALHADPRWAPLAGR